MHHDLYLQSISPGEHVAIGIEEHGMFMAALELLHPKLALGKLMQAAGNAVDTVFRTYRYVYVRSTCNMLYDR